MFNNHSLEMENSSIEVFGCINEEHFSYILSYENPNYESYKTNSNFIPEIRNNQKYPICETKTNNLTLKPNKKNKKNKKKLENYDNSFEKDYDNSFESNKTYIEELSNRITVNAKIEELMKIQSFIDESLNHLKVSNTFKLELKLVIEETFTNIVKHGYPEEIRKNKTTIKSDHEIKDKKVYISHEIEGNNLTLCIIDNGIKFNPLIENSNLSIDKTIGGLGLILIKDKVDDINYENKNNQNISYLKKIIK
ncbi:MAG: ATP-binding protein [Methanobrevibacter sp.]|jgi:anti-sigma regulatory factor (Ser/Thr protein kinase)|nr:ATP-binding protein [Candidatus Methanovirga meridionalis]